MVFGREQSVIRHSSVTGHRPFRQSDLTCPLTLLLEPKKPQNTSQNTSPKSKPTQQQPLTAKRRSASDHVHSLS